MKKKPIALLSASSTKVHEGENVVFDASSSHDPDCVIVSYWFDYGDGFNSGWISNSRTTKSYSGEGEYYAKVKVKDSDGLESDWSNEVKIIVTSTPKTMTDGGMPLEEMEPERRRTIRPERMRTLPDGGEPVYRNGGLPNELRKVIREISGKGVIEAPQYIIPSKNNIVYIHIVLEHSYKEFLFEREKYQKEIINLIMKYSPITIKAISTVFTVEPEKRVVPVPELDTVYTTHFIVRPKKEEQFAFGKHKLFFEFYQGNKQIGRANMDLEIAKKERRFWSKLTFHKEPKVKQETTFKIPV